MIDFLRNTLTQSQSNSSAALWLGAMNFGRRTQASDARRILSAACDQGIFAIDTANAYADGASESIVGDFLRSQRDSFVVATKCGFGRIGGKPEGLSAARIATACEESLRRLNIDRIDVYYLHVPDAQTPLAETLEAIAKLVEQQKIASWGISNYASWQTLAMMHTPGAHGRPAIAQQLYNVLIRELDIEWFAFAKAYGLHTTVYNPLAGGLLSGKHTRDGATQPGSRFAQNPLYQRRYFTQTMFDRVEALTSLANESGMTLLELAYGWVAHAPGVDSVLLGPASVEQLTTSVAACRQPLPAPLRSRINELHQAWMGTDTHYVRA